MRCAAALLLSCSLLAALPASALEEAPALAKQVQAGTLPPLALRLPEEPCPNHFGGKEVGRYGGDLVTLGSGAADSRLGFVYGYTRLMAYGPDLELHPDLLQGVEVVEGRRFVLHLRKGLRWSDGTPLTSEDFRFWWEDVANDAKLSPAGPPIETMRGGALPTVSFPDPFTVVYEWQVPNPYFLPELASTTPLQIFLPSHYLKGFHPKYNAEDQLKAQAEREGARNWAVLFNRRDDLYRANNPDLPTLDPWLPRVTPPADRYIFERNPYYCRLDPAGKQLPYLDRLIVPIVDGGLIAAKTGAGEADLQGRNLRFDSYAFLANEKAAHDYDLRLWKPGIGSHLALYPNLTVRDPVWRAVMHDVRFRRALSLGIDREEINAVIFFGLAKPGNNGAAPGSSMYDEATFKLWTQFDPAEANRLLDEMGLAERTAYGTRKLPDGRTMDIVVETAGDNSEEADILNLIRDRWEALGIRLHVKPSQLEVFRNRIFGGTALLSIGKGLENGFPTPGFAPRELAPTAQMQYQWPAWGQYVETKGKAGQEIDLEPALELRRALEEWSATADSATQRALWQRMLRIYADQQFSIGLVASVPQPIVVKNGLRNVPEDGALWNWQPGAQFGLHRPDSFWWDRPPPKPGQ